MASSTYVTNEFRSSLHTFPSIEMFAEGQNRPTSRRYDSAESDLRRREGGGRELSSVPVREPRRRPPGLYVHRRLLPRVRFDHPQRSPEVGTPPRQHALLPELRGSRSGLPFEIPDTYNPQFSPRPRANLGFFYTPVNDAVAAGISAVPRTKEQRILEDVEKLLPTRDIDRFVKDVIQELYDQIEAEIKRHLLRADVHSDLETGSNIQFETTTSVPEDIHPE